MAFNLFSNDINQDIGTFNYGTEKQKADRRRKLADMLQKQALTPEQGQIRQHGDFVGYFGGPTVASTALRVLGGYLGGQAEGSADEMQKGLDEQSRKALAYQLSQDPSALAAQENGRNAAAYKLAQERPGIEAMFNREQPVAETSNPVQAQTQPVKPQSELTPQQLGTLTAGLSGSTPPEQVAGTGRTAPFPMPVPPPAVQPQQQSVGQPAMPPAAPQVPAQAGPVPPAPTPQTPSMADRLEWLERVRTTGPMGEQFANAQLQQMFRIPPGLDVKTVKDEDGNESLVAINPRTGQSQLVYQGASSGRKAEEAKVKQGKAFGEARQLVTDAQDAVTASSTAISNLNDALGLVQELGNRGLISSTWNKVKSAVKENPKAAALTYLVNDGLLDATSKMKGALSDRDMEVIRNSRPDANATVEAWMLYAQRVMPILQQAAAKSKASLDGHTTTAREMGIPEFQSNEQGQQGRPQTPPTTGKSTKLDWSR